MSGTVRTLVIIPAYNEEVALPGVLAELAEHAPHLDVVVVDDGSRDRTAAVARAAGAAVVSLPYNLGVGGAIRCGFRYAIRMGYDRAIQIDADGQHDPAEIKRLLEALDEGADLVVGSRFADGGRYEVGLVRRLAMAGLRAGVRLRTGRSFTDTSSGFRGFSRRMVELFAASYPIDYLADTVEALLLACAAGMRVVEVPVRMRTRAAGLPSARRTKLLYHYLRLLVVILTAPGGRRREGPR